MGSTLTRGRSCGRSCTSRSSSTNGHSKTTCRLHHFLPCQSQPNLTSIPSIQASTKPDNRFTLSNNNNSHLSTYRFIHRLLLTPAKLIKLSQSNSTILLSRSLSNDYGQLMVEAETGIKLNSNNLNCTLLTIWMKRITAAKVKFLVITTQTLLRTTAPETASTVPETSNAQPLPNKIQVVQEFPQLPRFKLIRNRSTQCCHFLQRIRMIL